MKLLLTIAAFCCVFSSYAQEEDEIDSPPLEQKIPDSTFYLRFNSTGSYNKTDVNRQYLFNNNIKFTMERRRTLLTTLAGWVWGQQEKTLTNNDFAAVAELKFYPNADNHRFSYWGLANYTTSFSLKINSQFQTGAGIAYDVIDKKQMTLGISEGVLYDKSDIQLNDTVRDEYSTIRNSFRLNFKASYKILSFDAIGSLLNSFENGEDYIIRSNMLFSLKLNKWLSVNSGFVYNKFNLTKKENVLITYGILCEGYF